jgi:ribonuclease Z
MAGVGGGAAHVLAAHAAGARVPVLAKSAALQAKLHAVDAGFFPLLPLPPAPTAAEAAAAAAALPAGGAPGDSGLRFTLRPLARRGLDRAECAPELDPAAVAAALAAEKPEVLALAAAARGAAAAAALAAAPPACTAPGAADQFVLRFLGTGAAVPSKYRNVTGTLLDLPSADAAMLVDCGEGSLGQLRRCVGAAGAEAILRRLKLAWISHIHADHHVGLAPLLAARAALLGPGAPPVLVVGPRPLRRALAGYAALEPLAYRFVDAAATTAAPAEGAAAAESAAEDAAALAVARAALGLSRLESVRVVHCAHAYGLVLERCAGDAGAGAHPGWTLAFSGDTRPCPALAAAAAGATLLVHEATFEDALQEEAEAKKHCTTSEAVEAGVAAGAYRTLLTHFSQRYPKVPVVDANFGAAVGIAFDLMAVRLTDLPRLPALVPALKELFADEEEEGGEGEGAGAAEADDA